MLEAWLGILVQAIFDDTNNWFDRELALYAADIIVIGWISINGMSPTP